MDRLDALRFGYPGAVVAYRLLSWVAAALVCAACSFDKGGFGDGDDAAIVPTPDANRRGPDATAGAPDADPNAPDADPNAPDAAPGTPDAAPGTPDAAPIPDATPLADAPCAGSSIPFDPSNFNRCDLLASVASWDVPAGETWVVNTDTGRLFEPGGPVGGATTDSVLFDQATGPQIRIFSAGGVNVQAGGILAFTGTRPAALVSYTDITVDGIIWAGAEAETHGAGGGNDIACGAGRGIDGVAQTTSIPRTGGSGGSGGGYGQSAGKGAKVEDSGGSTTVEGAENGTTTIIPLRGGCRGGKGGLATGGLGGGGGGALQLVAAGTIGVNGAIAAPGGGGRGVAGAASGGGGGGSGGALLFEATIIDIAGVVSANGGAGAEGSRGGTAPAAGQDGHTLDADPAIGGFGTSQGGDGGDGGSSMAGAQDGNEGSSNGSAAAGGGGGGGAVGRIHLNETTTLTVTGLVTPPAE